METELVETEVHMGVHVNLNHWDDMGRKLETHIDRELERGLEMDHEMDHDLGVVGWAQMDSNQNQNPTLCQAVGISSERYG